MNTVLKLVKPSEQNQANMKKFTPEAAMRMAYSSLINSNIKTAQYLKDKIIPRGWDKTKYLSKLDANNAALKALCEAMLLLDEDRDRIVCTCAQGTVGDVLDLTMVALEYVPMADAQFRYEPLLEVNAPALCSSVFNRLGEKYGLGRCECCRDDVNELVMRIVRI